MRGWTNTITLALVAIFGASWAVATGPQFTGLLNFYDPSSAGFNKQRNSLATMDPNGPVFGTVTPLSRNWSDIVVAPGGSAYYTMESNEVWKFNAITGVGTKLPDPWGSSSSTGWLVGGTWDTARNRLVLASLSGEGFFFRYLDATNQWSTISSLNQTDLRSIAYRPSNDLIYALPNTIGSSMTQILKYNPETGAPAGALNLPVPIPEHEFATDLSWQMMLASDGELAVIAPRFVPRPGGGTMPGNWLYLINPDTGVISYSAPLPVPEPAAMGLLVLGALVLGRRAR